MVPSMFVPPGAMPRLQHFWFHVQPEDFCSGSVIVDDLALGHLPSLQSVRFCFDGKEKATQDVATKVEEMMRHEAYVHPNHPDIYIRIDNSLDWIPCMTSKFNDVPEDLHHFGYGLSYYLQKDHLQDHLTTSAIAIQAQHFHKEKLSHARIIRRSTDGDGDDAKGCCWYFLGCDSCLERRIV